MIKAVKAHKCSTIDVVSHVSRSFSSDGNAEKETEYHRNMGKEKKPSSIDEIRTTILRASLDHVPYYGWTEDAISSGVLDSNLPPSSIGMISDSRNKSIDLISFFMSDANDRFRSELEAIQPTWILERTPLNERIEQSIRLRLQYASELILAKRWHEGMALALLHNPFHTAKQIQDAVSSILEYTQCPSSGNTERMAIASVYIATELFMLTDNSPDFEQTWQFLADRITELDSLANGGNIPSLFSMPISPSPETVTATLALLSSFQGAIVSLAMPAARSTVGLLASIITPQVMTFMQPTNLPYSKNNNQGYPDARELDDLPPFEDSKAFNDK